MPLTEVQKTWNFRRDIAERYFYFPAKIYFDKFALQYRKIQNKKAEISEKCQMLSNVPMKKNLDLKYLKIIFFVFPFPMYDASGKDL